LTSAPEIDSVRNRRRGTGFAAPCGFVRVHSQRGAEQMQERGEREVATLGGGCFWCLEAVYQELRGVDSVVSGYAGGHVPEPTYEAVCAGTTGHAEVVQVTFDPAVVSYREVLELFFLIHDPTTKDRQGADVGSQYRSAIFYHDDSQRTTAEGVMRDVEEAGTWGAPLVTELAPLERFHPAEVYHQNYYRRNPGQGYCQVVIAPKLAKARSQFFAR
jgi:peptide-methionine (S)-S-oxide reductase